MENILRFVFLGVSGVALLFAIIALASDKWETFERVHNTISYEVKVGLWEVCYSPIDSQLGTKYCYDIEDIGNVVQVTDKQENSIEACKAMVFLAIFATAGAIVCVIILILVMKDKQILLFVAGGLDIAAGFFLMIALSVYVDNVKTNGSDLDYGFALDLIAWLAAWVAGGIIVTEKFISKE